VNAALFPTKNINTGSTTLNVFSSLASLAFFSCVGAAVISSASAAHPKPEPRKVEFEQALADYKQGRPTAAYGRLMRLADQGDAESARIALILLRHGEQLNGTAWGASQPQIDHWMRLARQPMEPLVAESGD
jgi:hypothetical protein